MGSARQRLKLRIFCKEDDDAEHKEGSSFSEEQVEEVIPFSPVPKSLQPVHITSFKRPRLSVGLSQWTHCFGLGGRTFR